MMFFAIVVWLGHHWHNSWVSSYTLNGISNSPLNWRNDCFDFVQLGGLLIWSIKDFFNFRFVFLQFRDWDFLILFWLCSFLCDIRWLVWEWLSNRWSCKWNAVWILFWLVFLDFFLIFLCLNDITILIFGCLFFLMMLLVMLTCAYDLFGILLILICFAILERRSIFKFLILFSLFFQRVIWISIWLLVVLSHVIFKFIKVFKLIF